MFPLHAHTGVQDHWKAQNQSKRVFLLTRSAFLGQQRVGATVWSGDVYGTYWGLNHQVPAGLNFALSDLHIGRRTLAAIGLLTIDRSRIPHIRNSTRAGLSTAFSVPSFARTAIGRTTSCGRYDKVEPILVNYDKLDIA